MAKVLCHTTMTIDGFVVGQADDMSWMTLTSEPMSLWPNFVPDRSATRGCQNLPRHHDIVAARPYEGAIEVLQFVLTHAHATTAGVRLSVIGTLQLSASRP